MFNQIIGLVVVPLLAFLAGNVSGYLLHDRLKRTFEMSEDSSKRFLMVCITLVWVASMIISLVDQDYEVPVAVHGLLGVIVGFFFYKPKGGDK